MAPGLAHANHRGPYHTPTLPTRLPHISGQGGRSSRSGKRHGKRAKWGGRKRAPGASINSCDGSGPGGAYRTSMGSTLPVDLPVGRPFLHHGLASQVPGRAPSRQYAARRRVLCVCSNGMWKGIILVPWHTAVYTNYGSRSPPRPDRDIQPPRPVQVTPSPFPRLAAASSWQIAQSPAPRRAS